MRRLEHSAAPPAGRRVALLHRGRVRRRRGAERRALVRVGHARRRARSSRNGRRPLRGRVFRQRGRCSGRWRECCSSRPRWRHSGRRHGLYRSCALLRRQARSYRHCFRRNCLLSLHAPARRLLCRRLRLRLRRRRRLVSSPLLSCHRFLLGHQSARLCLCGCRQRPRPRLAQRRARLEQRRRRVMLLGIACRERRLMLAHCPRGLLAGAHQLGAQRGHLVRVHLRSRVRGGSSSGCLARQVLRETARASAQHQGRWALRCAAPRCIRRQRLRSPRRPVNMGGCKAALRSAAWVWHALTPPDAPLRTSLSLRVSSRSCAFAAAAASSRTAAPASASSCSCSDVASSRAS